MDSFYISAVIKEYYQEKSANVEKKYLTLDDQKTWCLSILKLRFSNRAMHRKRAELKTHDLKNFAASDKAAIESFHPLNSFQAMANFAAFHFLGKI